MILQALTDYYERLANDPDSDVAPYGWSRQKIGFVVVLNDDGTLHAIEPPPGGDTDAQRSFTLLVPGQSKPSGSGINPCFLWDNATYMLGQLPEGRESVWAMERHARFQERHLALEADIHDPAFTALCRFLCDWSPDRLQRRLSEGEELSGFGVFRTRSAREYVHERPAIRAYWQSQGDGAPADAVVAPSLLTGAREPIARLHEPKIKGVVGGQSSGALLASFNLDAFKSYGKDQSYNAPIGERDAFRYCTALNRLLARNSGHRANLGGTTVAYWTERPSPVESYLGFVLSGVEDEETKQSIEAFLKSLRQGRPSDALEDADTPYYILGLAPNASRISVRFWLTGTAGEFARRMADHANVLELGGAPDGYRVPTIRRIVAETVPPSSKGWPDEDRVSPVLAGEVARAIFEGLPYPRSLLTGVIRRIRTEGFIDKEKRRDWRSGMHRRASIIKACLSRSRTSDRAGKELTLSLNEDHPDVGYHLGRLFAVLEKTQEEAHDHGINSTIRDKYFGAAAATPGGIFPRILTLHTHHLKKISNPGRRINLERMVGRVMEEINDRWPNHHSLDEQGLFFLGYYHQRNALYTKTENNSKDEQKDSED